MTDINHLPKGYDLPENRMTREEWKHYFECREKYDVKYSDDEVRIFLRQMDESAHRNDTETFFKLAKKNSPRSNICIRFKTYTRVNCFEMCKFI